MNLPNSLLDLRSAFCPPGPNMPKGKSCGMQGCQFLFSSPHPVPLLLIKINCSWGVKISTLPWLHSRRCQASLPFELRREGWLLFQSQSTLLLDQGIC